MQITNEQNIIKNNQLEKFISLLGIEYAPKKIIFFESKSQIIKYYIDKNSHIGDIGVKWIFGNGQGVYNVSSDTIAVFAYHIKEENIEWRQSALLMILAHELRHRYQLRNINSPKFKFKYSSEEKVQLKEHWKR